MIFLFAQGFSKQKFKGHLNTSKNFISSCFGSNQELIAGGSEVFFFTRSFFLPIFSHFSSVQDGKVYLWDTNSGHLLTRLSGHSSVVFDVQWHAKQSLLASCSADACVKLWWFDPLHKFF
jgi:WD40 repeat protein